MLSRVQIPCGYLSIKPQVHSGLLLLNSNHSVMILPQVHLRKPCYDFYYRLFRYFERSLRLLPRNQVHKEPSFRRCSSTVDVKTVPMTVCLYTLMLLVTRVLLHRGSHTDRSTITAELNICYAQPCTNVIPLLSFNLVVWGAARHG